MSDYLFVTGNLAADALMPIIERMEPDFTYEVAVLNISVAALMDTRWIARHLSDAHGCEQVMIPGYCPGDLSIIEDRIGVSVIRGPKDLKDLPKEILRKTTFHFISRVDELFELCLLDFTPSAFTLEKIFAEEIEKARKKGARKKVAKKTTKKTTKKPAKKSPRKPARKKPPSSR